MAFTRIGDIAARLIADPAKLAAAAQDTQRIRGDEPVTQGVGPSSSRMLSTVEGQASNGIGKGAEAETPAQLCPAGGVTGALGVVRVKQVRRTTLDTPLTMSRERYVATHAPRGRSPRPAAYLSLVVDNGVPH
jgi:hypothetical protein